MDFIQEKEKMQYEFLKKFPRRMKNVGLYAVIIQNSSQKLSWKQYGFTKFDEQINLLFEVLLYKGAESFKTSFCEDSTFLLEPQAANMITARVFPDVWAEIQPKIEGLPLVAHNSPFDEGCLKSVFQMYQMD